MAAQATATGTLGGTPVAHLLIYMLDRALSGTLVIEDPSGKKAALLVRDGAPVKVQLPEPFARLSEVLVTRGVLDQATAQGSFADAQAAGQLHGAHLLATGLLQPEVLTEALVEQLGLKAEWLCQLAPASAYGFYQGQDFLAAQKGPNTPEPDPLAIIWRTLRAGATPALVNTTLARLGDREIRLHPGSRPGRFGFDARERGVVDVLRAKPQSLVGLVGSGLLPELQIKRLLYGLVLTRHADLGTGALPVGVVEGAPRSTAAPTTSVAPTRAAPPAAPAPNILRPAQGAPSGGTAPSPEGSAFAEEVRERTATVGSRNYYEILGVDRTAASSAISAAFFQLARRWHPDRLSGETPEVREAAVRIFARMSEAHQVLTSEEQRREYERLMKEGGSTVDEQEMVQGVLRAAGAFQKAEVLARRGNIAEATREARIAAEGDPDQAEYVALYADLQAQDPGRAQIGYADLIKIVNEAKKKQPQNKKVRLYRARVLKRAGDAEQAYREFRSIVEEDANNVEAAREVRLHQMRRGNTTTDPGKTGSRGQKDKDPSLFGKLFKR